MVSLDENYPDVNREALHLILSELGPKRANLALRAAEKKIEDLTEISKSAATPNYWIEHYQETAKVLRRLFRSCDLIGPKR